MHISMNPVPTNERKVDQCFGGCIEKMHTNNNCLILFYVFRAVIVAVYLGLHLTIQEGDQSGDFQMLTLFLVLALGCNVVYVTFHNVLKFQVYQNLGRLYSMADRIEHCLHIDPNQDIQSCYESDKIGGLKICREKFQFVPDISRTDVDNVYIKRAERSCLTMIGIQIDRNSSHRFSSQLNNLMSVALFVYGLVVLFGNQGSIPSYQTSFLITYLLTEVMTRMFIYLVLFVLAISPLLCFGVCIYSCFCKRDETVMLPAKVQATQTHIRDCEGDCPICYQSIQENESIIVLRCSNKHIFHELCIKGWTKIGKNCPICRQLIN